MESTGPEVAGQHVEVEAKLPPLKLLKSRSSRSSRSWTW